MTNYKNSILIICPLALVANMKHLAGMWGESLADFDYFSATPNYQDSLNNKFVVRHTVATDVILEKMTVLKGGKVYDSEGQEKAISPLAKPKFDVQDKDGNFKLDVTKAQTALGKLALVEEIAENYQISTSVAIYTVNQEPHSVLARVGLVRIISNGI